MSDTLLISEALEQVAVQRFLRAKMRLKEMGKSKAGNPKRDVTFAFELNGNWYTIYHTLFGKRLDDLAGELEPLDEQWVVVGIGGFHPSESKPEQYGKADRVIFPSELAALFGVALPQQPVIDANSGGEEFSHPF